jgi:hypothetical protein
MWKLISFSRRHGNNHPEDAVAEYEDHLKANKAWWLDYYEHGGAMWSMHGHGPQCPWDTARRGGILVYLDDYEYPSKEKLYEVACCFLEEYNMWMAGSCYGYTALYDDEDDTDSCGGYIGMEALIDGIRDHAGDMPFEIMTNWTVPYHSDLGEEVKDIIARQDRKAA